MFVRLNWLPWLLVVPCILGNTVSQNTMTQNTVTQNTDPAIAMGLTADPAAVHVDRLCVKLAEGSGAELVRGRLTSSTGFDLAPVTRWLQGVTVAPLVPSLSREQLDAMHRHACAVLPPGRRPGHLGLWFRVRADDAAIAAAIGAALAKEPLVEHVHYEPRYALASAAAPRAAVPSDIPPMTPSFTAMQASHGPISPGGGHAVREVAGVYGARGTGVGVRVLEFSWILDHEDMSQLVAANFLGGGVPGFDPAHAHHGASGFSIIAGDRNTYGLTGIADGVQARFIALQLNGGIENSLAFAVTTSQPGDVFLMVVQALVPALGPGSWVPVEFYQSVFDASLTTTASGRHLVVPAGNGARSLDDPALLNRFDRSFRDSGAIIVASSDGGLLQRASYSNWGSRVDAHSWGEYVIGCGYGTLFFGDPLNPDLRQAYTAGAGGTSSSTPHLAGLVAAVQGAAKKQLGQTLSNSQMLSVLHEHGATTPDVIGRRLNLPVAFDALGIRDGLSVASADVMLNGTIALGMTGPANAIVALFGSFAAVDIPVGLNRNLHLDPASLVAIGAFVMPAGFSIVVPNNPALHGADLFFQAVRLDAVLPLYLTNSCQVTIL